MMVIMMRTFHALVLKLSLLNKSTGSAFLGQRSGSEFLDNAIFANTGSLKDVTRQNVICVGDFSICVESRIG